MQMLILATVKVVFIIVFLVLIARTRDTRPADDSFFEAQQWGINDAYKVLIPVLVLDYVHFLAYVTLPPPVRFWVPFISLPVYCITICICYFGFIYIPYGAGATIFGLDKSKLLKTGIRHMNLAAVFAMMALLGGLDERVSSDSLSSAAGIWSLKRIEFLVQLVLIVAVGPVLEELLCCGILFAPVARKLGTWMTICVMALLKTILHLHYVTESLLVFVSSFLFGVVYVNSRSLSGPIIWHISFNFYDNRLGLKQVVAPQVDSVTMDKYYIYALLIGVLTVNLFRLIESARSD